MLHVHVTRPPLKGLQRSAPPNPHVYSEGEVSQQLGILHQSTGWRLGYLMALIRSPLYRFPEPMPRYNHRAGKLVDGAASVSPLSQWARGAVDTWFERFLPPGAQHQAAIEQDQQGDQLDANAANLAALLSGRRVRA